MPNLDGVQTIQKLQKMYEKKELHSKIPTIFMISGYGKNNIDLDSIAVDCFISKPVTPSDLFDAIVDAKGGAKRATVFDTKQSIKQFANTHILIVEDNAINQEVISLMLQKAGITYEIAQNGQEGVEMFFDSRKKFDLVLMDLQMPIMGGYEATKEIRKKDSTTPIVALTAAAMVEDRQKAFEAGMDEHIGKPIDKNQLYEVISKLTSVAIEFQKTHKKLDLVLDMEYLEDTLSSKERINSLLLSFKKQLLSGEFQDIENQIAQNSTDAHTKVHTLKGVSGNLGAFELFKILETIDTKYKKDDTISKDDLKRLDQAKQNILKKLDEIKEIQKSDTPVETLVEDEVYKLFEKVQHSLSQGLKVEEQKIEMLYENLKQRVDQKELEKWKELVEEFDFDEASQMMQGWEI
jgi:CheY-like chemotaxis protein